MCLFLPVVHRSISPQPGQCILLGDFWVLTNVSSNLKVSLKKYLPSIYVAIEWLQKSKEATVNLKNFMVTLVEAEAGADDTAAKRYPWQSANQSCWRAVDMAQAKPQHHN